MATTLHVCNEDPAGNSKPRHMTIYNAEHFPLVGDLMETPEGRFVVTQRLFSFPSQGNLDVLLTIAPV